MSWRVWLFRSIVCSLCAGAGVVGWLVYLQTNSTALRAKVVEQIQSDFPGLEVQIGSAWIHPFGGLWLRDVRLYRREDPLHPFLTIPSATVYHDKEQLAQGRIAIRKVELVRPTIRLRRDAEGNWNLPNLPRTNKSDGPLPMLVIRQGTLAYEDRTGGLPRPILEAQELSLTVVNDPTPRIAFNGQSDTPLGILKYSGEFQRGPNVLALAIDAPAYTVTHRVMEQLGGHFSDIKLHLTKLEGQGDARLELRYQLGGKAGWQPDLRVNLRRGHFGHDKLPLSPLQEIELTARYHDGMLTVEKGQARSGPTRVTVDLEAALALEGPRSDDPEQILTKFNLAIENLTLSDALFDQLPANLQQIRKDFKPAGPVGLTFKFERRDRWWSRRCIVHPEGLTAEFVEFPYRLEQLRGALEQETTSGGKDELNINLTGMSGGRPIILEGTAAGSGDQLRLDLKIHGRGLTLDDNLRRALGKNREILDSFRPIGTGDFVARLKNKPGDPRTDIHIQIDFVRLAICHEQFPYPLEGISGTLRMRFGGETRVTFEQFQGMHSGGEATIDGSYLSTSTGSVLRVKLRAAALPFDADLAGGFARIKLQPLWKAVRPSGRFGFTGDLIFTDWNAPQGARKPPSRLEVFCHQFSADSLLPDFLPYELNAVTGTFHFADDRVTMTNLQAQHRTSRLHMGARDKPCVFVLKPNGGVYAKVQQLQIAPLVVDDELLSALPSQLRSACAALEASGPMSLTAGEFIIDTTADAAKPSIQPIPPEARIARMSGAALHEPEMSPWMYWDQVNVRLSGASVKLGLHCENVHGLVSMQGEYRNGQLGAVQGNVIIDQASIHRQPVQDFHAHLVMDPARNPNVLQVKNIKGKMFGGALAGEVALMLEPTIRYDIRLNALGIKLEELARHNKLEANAELSGRAEARLYLNGQGADLKNLRGGGVIHVPKGRFGNLPPLLDLLKFVKLQAPDGTFFEEAFAQFRFQGEVVHFEQLDLVGNLISLTGEGEMKLDGTGMKLNIYPVWSRLVQMLPAPVRDIPNSISRSLYKIEMSGEVGGKLDLRSEAMPIIVEPVQRLIKRMRK